MCWSKLEAALSYIRFVRLQYFNSLCMCCIIRNCSFRARALESTVFYRFVFFQNFSPLLFFIFSLKCVLAVKLGRRRRRTGQVYMRNTERMTFPRALFHSASTQAPFWAPMLKVLPQQKVLETRCCWRCGGTRQEESVSLSVWKEFLVRLNWNVQVTNQLTTTLQLTAK